MQFNFQITFFCCRWHRLCLSSLTVHQTEDRSLKQAAHYTNVPWMSGTLHVAPWVALKIYYHHPISVWWFSSFSLSLFHFEILIAAMNSKDDMGGTTIFQLTWHNLIVSHRIMKWKLKGTLVDDKRTDCNQYLWKNIIIRVWWVGGIQKNCADLLVWYLGPTK